jgi:hypothetical protein
MSTNGVIHLIVTDDERLSSGFPLSFLACRSRAVAGYRFRLFDQQGNDLGTREFSEPTFSPGDVVALEDRLYVVNDVVELDVVGVRGLLMLEDPTRSEQRRIGAAATPLVRRPSSRAVGPPTSAVPRLSYVQPRRSQTRSLGSAGRAAARSRVISWLDANASP